MKLLTRQNGRRWPSWTSPGWITLKLWKKITSISSEIHMTNISFSVRASSVPTERLLSTQGRSGAWNPGGERFLHLFQPFFFIFMGKRLSETFTFQHSKNVVLSLNMHWLLVASYLFHSPTSQLGEAARPPRSEPGKQGEFSRVDFRSAVWDS